MCDKAEGLYHKVVDKETGEGGDGRGEPKEWVVKC